MFFFGLVGMEVLWHYRHTTSCVHKNLHRTYDFFLLFKFFLGIMFCFSELVNPVNSISILDQPELKLMKNQRMGLRLGATGYSTGWT